MRLIKPKKSFRFFAWGALLLGVGALSGFAAGHDAGSGIAERLLLGGVVLSVFGAALLLVSLSRALRNLDGIAEYFFRQQQRARGPQPPVHTSELPKIRTASKPR
ncbi:hypothetical protein GCM10023166_26360 [Paeniglutamicibacter cryotolerans]